MAIRSLLCRPLHCWTLAAVLAAMPASAARAQLPTLDSSAPVKVPLDAAGNPAPKLPDMESLRARETEAVSGIQSLTAQVVTEEYQLPDLVKRILELSKEMDKLKLKRQLALEDYRLGRFCSVCGNSKSEIAPEDFQEHLQRVHGHEVPATAEQLAKEKAKWDALINPKEKELAELIEQRNQAEETIKSGRQAVQWLIDVWKATTSLDHALLEHTYIDLMDEAKKLEDDQTAQRADLERKYRDLLATRPPPPAAVLDAVRTAIKQCQELADIGAQRYAQAWRDRDKEMQQMETRFDGQYAAMGKSLRELNGQAEANDGLIGLVQNLPHLEASLRDAPYSIELDHGKIAIHFKASRYLSFNLETFATETGTTMKFYGELFHQRLTYQTDTIYDRRGARYEQTVTGPEIFRQANQNPADRTIPGATTPHALPTVDPNASVQLRGTL